LSAQEPSLYSDVQKLRLQQPYSFKPKFHHLPNNLKVVDNSEQERDERSIMSDIKEFLRLYSQNVISLLLAAIALLASEQINVY
jgi:hypothetical protein